MPGQRGVDWHNNDLTAQREAARNTDILVIINYTLNMLWTDICVHVSMSCVLKVILVLNGF